MNPRQKFLPQVMPLMLKAAKEYVWNDATIPSKAIRQDIDGGLKSNYTKGELTGSLSVAFYWSKFFHDGRDVVATNDGKKLVYYLDPRRDPRNGFGKAYPITRSDVVTTKSQWKRIKEDAEKGLVVFTEIVGSAPAHPYFSDTQVEGVTGGMVGLTDELDKVVGPKADDYVKALLESKGLWDRTVKVNV